MKARVARLERTGGPEVIGWHDVDLPTPAAGEVLVRHEAVGLNFIDTDFSNGVDPTSVPSGLGSRRRG